MSRPVLILAVVLILVVAAVFVLAGRSGERPMAEVEQSVSLENLA